MFIRRGRFIGSAWENGIAEYGAGDVGDCSQIVHEKEAFYRFRIGKWNFRMWRGVDAGHFAQIVFGRGRCFIGSARENGISY